MGVMKIMKKKVETNETEMIVVRGALTLCNVRKSEGTTTRCYFAILLVDGKKINVTYDCMADNLIIHEWYWLGKEVRDSISEKIKDYFRGLEMISKPVRKEGMMQKLFREAVGAIDRYNKSVEMAFPDAYIENYKRLMEDKLKEINVAGATERFAEYATTF
jgi:hypothetical protein